MRRLVETRLAGSRVGIRVVSQALPPVAAEPGSGCESREEVPGGVALEEVVGLAQWGSGAGEDVDCQACRCGEHGKGRGPVQRMRAPGEDHRRGQGYE